MQGADAGVCRRARAGSNCTSSNGSATKTLIGALPKRWNHLVGEYPHEPDVSNVHFTVGGPYLDEYRDCDYASDWFAARDALGGVQQRTDR